MLMIPVRDNLMRKLVDPLKEDLKQVLEEGPPG